MKIFFLAALLLTSACTTKPHTVVYGSHWRQSWQNAVMNQCRSESHLLTLRIYESKLAAGYELTQADVDVLEKHLMDSCVKYYQITI